MIDFESVWLAEHINHNYRYIETLSDDEYIEYHKWEKENEEAMYAKYAKDTVVIRGGPYEHLIFHGGCLSCSQQTKHGVDHCKGCQYFRANWGLPDLSDNAQKEVELIYPTHSETITPLGYNPYADSLLDTTVTDRSTSSNDWFWPVISAILFTLLMLSLNFCCL